MLLILSNTPISKHYCLCLNPCLDFPTKSQFYVKNLVTKHNKDLNSKSLIYRKIGPFVLLHLWKTPFTLKNRSADVQSCAMEFSHFLDFNKWISLTIKIFGQLFPNWWKSLTMTTPMCIKLHKPDFIWIINSKYHSELVFSISIRKLCMWQYKTFLLRFFLIRHSGRSNIFGRPVV